MDNEKHVGYELRQTDIMIRRFAEHRRTAAGYGDLTFAQGGMIHYLYRHREEPIYQKDLEKRFDIRRSTATGILQNLEKNGYICRSCDAGDARMKQIVLTQTALDMEEAVRLLAEEDEALFCRGMSEEEINRLMDLLGRIRRNIAEQEDTYD
ncbi:MAG: MarR family transcriptional regulator [Solobacterium sp.]|nr:MarR family transcriptional regulator [Solobacterium sp.]